MPQEHSPNVNTDRKRGILSPEDRAYLRGTATYESASGSRQARRRIRERTRNAFLDFALLYQYLQPRDRRQIMQVFSELDEHALTALQTDPDIPAPREAQWDVVAPDGFHAPLFLGGMRHTLAFCFLCLYDVFTEFEDTHPSRRMFERTVETLVERALRDAFAASDEHVAATVDIEFTDDEVDIDAIRDRFDDGEETVSRDELQWLIHERRIDVEELDRPLVDAQLIKDMRDALAGDAAKREEFEAIFDMLDRDFDGFEE